MFKKNGLIDIRGCKLKEVLNNELQGEVLDIEIGMDIFEVNVAYSNDEDLRIDMESMKIEDESLEVFKDVREFFSDNNGFKLVLSLEDISEIINNVSGETLIRSLRYFYDYQNNYIQLVTE